MRRVTSDRGSLVQRSAAVVALVALVATGAAVPSAAAAPGQGAISGTVTVPDGLSPSSVSVVAQRSGGGFVMPTAVSEDGSYLVDGLEPGSYVVEFQTFTTDLVSEYFDDAATTAQAEPVTVVADATADVDARLELGASISGVITDVAGEPVVGQYVSVQSSALLGLARSATTDATGAYRVGGLRPGSYRISTFGAPGGNGFADAWYGGTSYVTAALVPVEERSEVLGKDIVLQQAATVTGRVLHGGEPVGSANVSFTGSDGSSSNAWTGPDGSFSKSLAPGTYTVKFDGPFGRGMKSQYWDGADTAATATPLVLTGGQTIPLGDVTLTDGGVITGKVTDSAGRPVPDLGVSAYTMLVGGSGQATTAADGTYRISGLTAGDYYVQFGSTNRSLFLSEYYGDTQSVMDAQLVPNDGNSTVSGIDAQLAPAAGVTGRVLDATGNPVAGAWVQPSPRFTASGSWMSGMTDADGRYSIGGLPAGDWSFDIHAPSGSPWAGEYYLDQNNRDEAAVVALEASVRSTLDDVRLERGVALTGRVLDPDGAPVVGASVRAERDRYSFPMPVVTDADGRYTLAGLRPGSYAIKVTPVLGSELVDGYYPDGGIPETPQRITIETDAQQTAPDTRLQRGVTVYGTVTTSTGVPLPDANVWLQLDDPAGYGTSAQTGADGTYRAVGLRPGDFTVQAGSWGTDYAGIASYWVGPGSVTTRHSLATRLHGTSGEAISGITIALPPRGSEVAELAIAVTPDPPVLGRPVTVTLTATGAHGTPTGSVDVWEDGGEGALSTLDLGLDPDGRAQFTFTPAPDAEHGALRAVYSGDATYDGDVWGSLDFEPGAPLPPTVSAISPSSVSALGGSQVTITGTSFGPASTVTVGGVPATGVVVESSTTLRATVPPHAVGDVPVVVTTEAGASNSGTLTYMAQPTQLSLVSSAASITQGGSATFTATVTSSGGAPTGPVQFVVDGGEPVSVATTAGVATFTTVGLTVGTHTVTASYAGGSTYGASTGSVTQVVVPAAAPTVTEVSPAVATTAGGVRVTVSGTSLTGATAVTFGDTPGTDLQVVSSTKATVVVPAHVPGPVPVRVTTPGGVSTTSSSFLFVDTSAGLVSQTPQRAEFRRDIAPYAPVCVQIAGTNGVPVGASGVVLNVTTVTPAGVGHVIVYPDTDGTGATPAPDGSTVNFEPGADVANAAFVQLPANGKVCYLTRSGGTAGIVLDVTGFTMPDAGIVTQASQRLVDTRSGGYHVGTVTGPVAPRTVQTVQVRGQAGVPENATAVILSAAVTGVGAPGNLRIFPAGQDVPLASVVNFAPGKDKATATIVGLPASGKISFYSDTSAPVSSSPVQVILDVTGYIVGDTTYSPLPPKRVLDSRPGSGHLGPIPGELAARTAYQVHLAGTGGIPTDATSVVLNVVAIGPSSVGNLRLYPHVSGSSAPPTTSNINYVPGRDISNLVVVALPDDGIVNVYSDMFPGGTVHVAVDVVGYISAG